MNRMSTDLFPQRVSPQNFAKGDVVKKIYMDNIQTPYVGIVTAIIPSTNKVEVQWPDSTGLEEPWELIKVNPILNPPVVNQDKSYDTYQKRINSDGYVKGLQPYNILKDFIGDHLKPILLHASDLYNEGYSKSEAYRGLTAKFDNRDIVKTALNGIYNDEVDIEKTANLVIDGEETYSELIFKGSSDAGFRVAYVLGNEEKEYFFDNYRSAVDNYKRITEVFKSLEANHNYSDVVSKVSKEYKETTREE